MQDISKDLDSNLLLAELEEEDIFPGEADPNSEEDADFPEMDEVEIEEQIRKYGSKQEKADLLAKYMKEINRFKLLSSEEERDLTILYHETRNQDVGRGIICANLRLVVKIALGFHKFWMKNLMDLIQEGNKGLTQSIKKFDPYRGIKLSYYASLWIKAYILKHLMDNWRLVKIGTTQAQRKLFYNLKREKMKLEALGFEPDAEMLAKNLNVREEDIIEMDQRLNGWDLSLEAPLKEGSDEIHENFLPATESNAEEDIDREIISKDFQKKLREFRKNLNPKELDILNLRLLSENPLRLEQIGKIHEVSRERIRQIEKKLIKKIKAYLEASPPPEEPSLPEEPLKIIPDEALLELEAICVKILAPLELEVVGMRYCRFGKYDNPLAWNQIGKAKTIVKLNNGCKLTNFEAQGVLAKARKKILASAHVSQELFSALPKKYRSLISGINGRGKSITPDIREDAEKLENGLIPRIPPDPRTSLLMDELIEGWPLKVLVAAKVDVIPAKTDWQDKFRALSKRKRTILTLAFKHGSSAAEIAEKEGGTSGGINSQKYAALKELKAAFDNN